MIYSIRMLKTIYSKINIFYLKESFKYLLNDRIRAY